jgi:hypothetical protein
MWVWLERDQFWYEPSFLFSLLEGLTASYAGKATLQELATFDSRRTAFVVWSNRTTFLTANVLNIVPT